MMYGLGVFVLIWLCFLVEEKTNPTNRNFDTKPKVKRKFWSFDDDDSAGN